MQLLSGSEVNGTTTTKFTRRHNTCGDKDMIVGVRFRFSMSFIERISQFLMNKYVMNYTTAYMLSTIYLDEYMYTLDDL